LLQDVDHGSSRRDLSKRLIAPQSAQDGRVVRRAIKISGHKLSELRWNSSTPLSNPQLIIFLLDTKRTTVNDAPILARCQPLPAKTLPALKRSFQIEITDRESQLHCLARLLHLVNDSFVVFRQSVNEPAPLAQCRTNVVPQVLQCNVQISLIAIALIFR
jgi:hypothetical protein